MAQDVHELIAGLSDLAGRIDGDEELASTFLLGLARVALALERDPVLRDKTGMGDFLAATAGDLRGARLGFDLFTYETRSRLDELLDPGAWIAISRRRSALQFLHDLYAGTPLADELPSLDELDERLRERCGGEGFLEPHEIPEGTPDSHWWWWCPRTA
jgi:hypothetical protein